MGAESLEKQSQGVPITDWISVACRTPCRRRNADHRRQDSTKWPRRSDTYAQIPVSRTRHSRWALLIRVHVKFDCIFVKPGFDWSKFIGKAVVISYNICIGNRNLKTLIKFVIRKKSQICCIIVGDFFLQSFWYWKRFESSSFTRGLIRLLSRFVEWSTKKIWWNFWLIWKILHLWKVYWPVKFVVVWRDLCVPWSILHLNFVHILNLFLFAFFCSLY